MKKIILLLIFCSCITAGFTQYVPVFHHYGGGGSAGPVRALEIEASGVYETFHLGALKKMQSRVKGELFNSYGVNARTVQKYPDNLGYKASIGLVFDQYTLGASFRHSSTASRLAYADYSGSLYFDSQLSSNAIGLYFSYPIELQPKLQMDLRGDFLYEFGKLSFTEDFTITDLHNSSYTSEFGTYGAIVSPRIQLRYYPLDFLFVKSIVGGNLTIVGNLHEEGNMESTLKLDRNAFAQINWSGVFIGAGLGFKIPVRSEEMATKE